MTETNSTIDSTQDENVVNPESNQPKKKKKYSKDEITEENCKFQQGQELEFTRVRFPGHARSYSFLIGNRNLMYGQKVVAMSDRGMAVGYINSFPYKMAFKKDMLPLKSISKIATENDIEKEQDVYKSQKQVETLCQGLIEKHKLDMNLTHVEFTQFGKKVVFYFVAPARVDFRGLVKDLVNELKLRIELRQISVRDRAASMGALGPCGRELCCSSFLSKYGNVSIKMAKNQNLTLNYSKLNGVCGQLKCCLSYEEDVYSKKRNRLPKEGELVETVTGDFGKVKKLDILKQQFDLLTDKGVIKRFTHDQVKKGKVDKKFPHRFENISDETSNIIGEKKLSERRKSQKEKDYIKSEKKASQFAIDRILELTDYLPEKEPGEREKMFEQAQKSIEESLNKKLKTSFDPFVEFDQGSHSPDTQIDNGTSTVEKRETNKDKNNNRRSKNYRSRNKNRNYNKNNNRNRNAAKRNNPKKES